MRQLIWAPHLRRNVVLGGCKIPDKHAPMLKLGNYMDVAQLPPAPTSCDYSDPAMSVISDEEGNDAYGDCVLAEEAHFIAVMTGNAGKLFAYTRDMTLAAYSALTGFNASNPASDQGTDPLVCLNYFTQNAYADGSKLAGYIQVDATNRAQVEFAISAFGNLKIWLSVPTAYISPFPSGNGFVWDVAPPNPDNGHCIGSCAYNSTNVAVVGSNSQGVQVMTWGLVGTITWAAFAALCVPSAGGGCATRVTLDWLNASIGKTPSGFAWRDLIADFDTMGGTLMIPPPPAPPSPTPAGLATFAQATSWLAEGINGATALETREQAIAAANAGLLKYWPAA